MSKDQKEYKASWYLRNKERLLQKRKQHYNQNKVKIIKQTTKYNKDHKSDPNYHRNNPETKLRYFLKHRHNIELEEYHVMLQKQQGKCAICGEIKSRKSNRLCVDHCHSTGKFRGLLCDDCNLGLGNFKDKIELLKIAIQYLEETK